LIDEHYMTHCNTSFGWLERVFATFGQDLFESWATPATDRWFGTVIGAVGSVFSEANERGCAPVNWAIQAETLCSKGHHGGCTYPMAKQHRAVSG
jgi:hypothetical protein